MTTTRLPKAPTGLGSAGKRLWSDLHKQFQIEDAHQLELLAAACRTADDLVAFEARLAADGRFVTDRFGQVRAHPAVAAVRDARGLMARLLRELALPADSHDSRPPTLKNRYLHRD